MSDFIANLTAEQKILLKMTAKALFDADDDISFDNISFDDISFDELFFEAQIQAVELVSFNNLHFDNIEPQERDFIKKKLNKCFLRNMNVDKEHIRLDDMMKTAGVRYVIIKGLASAVFYPDPLMRSMGDVDFFVDERDIEAVNNVLLENGFTARAKTNSHHITYDNDTVRYEVHFAPPGIPQGEKGEKLKEFFTDMLDNRINVKTELGEISVPDKFHHGLILLLHTVHHMTGDGLGLRHLCDWAVFIHSMSEDEFRSLFEQKLKEVGLWHFAMLISAVCGIYLGCSCEIANLYIDKELCEGIIEDIFSSGNFGQKNVDRSHESLLISSKNEKGINEKSLFSQGVSSINEIVYSNWKIVRKIKLLLPVGWLFFGLRYIIRSLLGMRPKIRIKKVINEAQMRKEFYYKLKLFETDPD